MSDAPERIWAVTEPDDISAQILGDVYAQQLPDGMVGNPVEYIRSDLARPKVKALIWDNFGLEMWADCILGRYYISGRGGRWSWAFDADDPYHQGEQAETEEAAKAAAQADYEKRILSALEGYE